MAIEDTRDTPEEYCPPRRGPSGGMMIWEPCGWCSDPYRMPDPADYDDDGVCIHCGGTRMVETEDCNERD